MTVLLWTLGVILYLIIGGFVATMMDEQAGDWVMVSLFWPLLLTLFVVITPLALVASIGSAVITFVASIGGLIADWVKEKVMNR